jgi:hypothetical protein
MQAATGLRCWSLLQSAALLAPFQRQAHAEAGAVH